jgi:hypothetical protein
MKKQLKRIEPLSAGKVLGLVYFLGSFLFVPFFAVAMILPALIPQSANAGQPPAGVMVALGLGMMLIAPFFYGAMGFIAGCVSALIYNLVAKWIGGIQVEVENIG